jgi:hypothetical protein
VKRLLSRIEQNEEDTRVEHICVMTTLDATDKSVLVYAIGSGLDTNCIYDTALFAH